MRPRLTAGVLTLALALIIGLAGPAHSSTVHHKRHTARHRTTRHATVHHASYRHARHHRVSSRHHKMILGQRAMDSERATQIQQALIQAHYLSGSPTGQWDPETQAAMEKYQTDNGWQSKIAPDSRALIKLGLGPKQDEGEYSSNPVGVSSLSPESTPSADAIRTMAISEMPAVTQN